MTTKTAIRKQNRLPCAFDACPRVFDAATKAGQCMSRDDKANSIRWELVDFIRAEINEERYVTKAKLETAINRMIASGQRGIARF